MTACTIVARNYLAYARVLARSYAHHHPGERLCVLVVDADVTGYDGRGEPFELVRPRDLAVDEQEFHVMATIYSALELATAVKPLLLRHLLARGEPVLYLDPDIEVFAPLHELDRLAHEHSIVLVPHVLAPIPDDGLTPTHADIVAAGVYNLGFVAVGERAAPFLDWWDARLRRDCVVAPEEGLFVDQRLIDFVPGYFDHTVARDAGYDVAYWNLHERDVSEEPDGRLTVAGGPLRFFHFSGFDPMSPHLLSKHQRETPRVLLGERPALARLCARYAERLLEAGYTDTIHSPYGFGDTSDRLVLDRRMRRLFRTALIAADADGGESPPDPFDSADPAAFTTWCDVAVDAGEPPISRYVHEAWRERADLRQAFPDILGAARDDFLDWMGMPGSVFDPPIPERLRPVAPPFRAPPRREAPAPGVNVAGYVYAESGVGEAARLLVSGLDGAAVPYAVVPYRRTVNRQQRAFAHNGGSQPRFGTNVVCVNADEFPNFVSEAGPAFTADRYTVALWFWEVEEFPESMRASAALADEIWVASRHAAAAIAPVVDTPVLVAPLPIVARTAAPEVTRDDLGLPGGYVFLFAFDFNSVVERKNPFGLIEAFSRAFAPGEGPTLVIKTVNGRRHADSYERLIAAASARPDVLVVDRYLDDAEQQALTALADAYVSLHRSEGFGLTMAEAMALGKPVIATGYSGNLEFMTAWNSRLVPYELVEVGPGSPPYPPTSRWAEPDLDAAAAAMRELYERPEDARRLGERARADLAARHGPDELARFLRRRLPEIERIRAARAVAPPPGPPATAPRGRAFRTARRLWWRLPGIARDRLRPILFQAPSEPQPAVGEEAIARLAALEERLARPDPVTATVEELEKRVAIVEETAAEDAAATRVDVDREVARLLGSLNALLDDMAWVKGELRATPYVSDPALIYRDEGRGPLGFASLNGGKRHDGLYRGFEEIFRGPEQLVRELQERYVPLLLEPVVDLGCGRGELLDLAREAGIAAIGVDLDEGMVRRSREKGHDVAHADALEFLEERDDASVGTIFTAQVAEHLAADDLQRLFALASRKLRPGGAFVVETVNPHSPRALKAFWVDPTHVRPLFPEALVALSRLHGFGEAEILFPTSDGDFDADLRTQGAYALVTRARG